MRISDGSSDVCSSDLIGRDALLLPDERQVVGGDGLHVDAVLTQVLGVALAAAALRVLVEDGFLCDSSRDRKSVVSGKSVSVRVDLGGRRSIKKKHNNTKSKYE